MEKNTENSLQYILVSCLVLCYSFFYLIVFHKKPVQFYSVNCCEIEKIYFMNSDVVEHDNISVVISCIKTKTKSGQKMQLQLSIIVADSFCLSNTNLFLFVILFEYLICFCVHYSLSHSMI